MAIVARDIGRFESACGTKLSRENMHRLWTSDCSDKLMISTYSVADRYKKTNGPLDYWGTPIEIVELNGRRVLVSYGADKKPGGRGDKEDLYELLD